VSPLAIQGPRAIELARDLFGADLVDGLGMFHHRAVELDGIPMVLCRSGWSKQGGYELFLTDGSKGDRLWDVVMAAGAPYDVGPGAPDHQERIESGLLSFAADHDRETDPIEAGLAAYTSLDGDHCFVGRDALEARLLRDDRRPIVNVRLAGSHVRCEHAWPATRDGRPIGELRNAVWSTRLDGWIGIAQVMVPHDRPGTVFDVTTPDGDVVQATVSPQPFGTVQS
jgi:glycine cleavage system aminomethyltransferase T